MPAPTTAFQTCVIIGASHAGVNLAFNLRQAGWVGEIHLIDADPELPYHRPPLSKAYLSGEGKLDGNRLKSADGYTLQRIKLHLGTRVRAINPLDKTITLTGGQTLAYAKLVLATGARPLIPPIAGIEKAKKLYPLRTARDLANIRKTLGEADGKQVVIIGGGYIGLETAASLRKLGAAVTVLEREDRVLARVTAPVMSRFFTRLHEEKGVSVLTGKNVVEFADHRGTTEVRCSDGSVYAADLVVVGVGIRVNSELAAAAGLEVDDGICVDPSTRTSVPDIHAIGDCTRHHNPHYDRMIRLESVQNAVDQAGIAAKAICGAAVTYDTIPWFWSDQYDVKLQMVGLSEGYDEVVVRQEAGTGPKFSAWYFRGNTLLAVDAVNNAKAYVLGTRCIKSGRLIDRRKLVDTAVNLKEIAG